MYAVFRTGGKQYRARQGERVRIERLDAAVGDSVRFDEVLVIGEGGALRVGKPLVEGSNVQAKVIAQGLGDKVKIVKFRRRKHYQRMKGHRQRFTEVEITSISGA